MTIIIHACPKCGCRDLRPFRVEYGGSYWTVTRCFKCGWRAEAPGEAGRRMARESMDKIRWRGEAPEEVIQ